jgi:hypothetical protein
VLLHPARRPRLLSRSPDQPMIGDWLTMLWTLRYVCAVVIVVSIVGVWFDKRTP